MLFDTHTHADYSCDAEQTIGEAAAAAKARGIGIILTEHWDRYYPTNPEMFLFDIDDYFKKDGPFRSDRVLLGIEVGLQPRAIEEDRKMVQAHPFDEVVGSMHCFDGLDMYEPPPMMGSPRTRRCAGTWRIPSGVWKGSRISIPTGTSITFPGTCPIRIPTCTMRTIRNCGTGCSGC